MASQDNPTYYERYDWDEQDFSEMLKKKLEKIFSIIPDDVKSIVDIGCGNGAITNQLAEKYYVLGIDRSKNALQYVNVNKFSASSDKIGIKNSTFDLVFSSELVEHLEEEIFRKTLEEFKRISRKYVLVTFPNNEIIEKDYVKCPECYHIFNKSYHLRSLGEPSFVMNFRGFQVMKCYEFGKGKRGYNKILLKIKHKLVSSEAWIPPRWTKNASRNAMCPNCEKDFVIPYRFSVLGFLCDSINSLISPFKPYWLFILLKKNEL